MEKISKDKLEPNKVYAVQFVTNSHKERGVIMVNAKGKIWRSWNICERNQWTEKEIALTPKHSIYPCTEMERQFAHEALNALSQRCHNQTLLSIMRRQKRELHYYRTDKWHGVAERVNKTFNGGGYSHEEE